MFATRYRLLYALLLGVYSGGNVLFMEALGSYGLPVAPGYLVGLFGVVVVLIWEGNRLIERALPGLARQLPARLHPLVPAFALSLPATALATAGPAWLLQAARLHLPPSQFALGLKLLLVVGFRINLFLNTLNALAYANRQLRRAQVEAEALKKAGAQARLQSLREQVNPHFLFNNLNVLAALLYQSPDEAAEFIQQLARVYRYVLQQQEKDLVELGTELDFLASYVFVLRTRFRGALDVRLDVPAHLRPRYVVPVALQMLFENALKHNVASQRQPLRIELFAEADGWLVVRNTRQARATPPDTSLQLGLRNIVARYGFVSERAVQVEATATSFTVKLPLLSLGNEVRR